MDGDYHHRPRNVRLQPPRNSRKRRQGFLRKLLGETQNDAAVRGRLRQSVFHVQPLSMGMGASGQEFRLVPRCAGDSVERRSVCVTRLCAASGRSLVTVHSPLAHRGPTPRPCRQKTGSRLPPHSTTCFGSPGLSVWWFKNRLEELSGSGVCLWVVGDQPPNPRDFAHSAINRGLSTSSVKRSGRFPAQPYPPGGRMNLL
jgi:hypothetical protein